MKTLYKIISFLKFGSIFLIICTAFMTYKSYSDELKEFEEIKYNIETAKKGFLRIKFYSGRGSRSVTISAYGYIEGVDSSKIEPRRVIIGIGEEFSKDFENKFEGDLIPIWYDESKNFVYARVHNAYKETIQKLKKDVERSKAIYLKVNAILILLPFLFYSLQKLIAKFLT